MWNLIDVLYSYAQETKVPPSLRTQEYRCAVHGLEEGWESFRSGLTEDQERTLDRLLSKESTVEHLEDKAAFAAGISIGLGLGRL